MIYANMSRFIDCKVYIFHLHNLHDRDVHITMYCEAINIASPMV